jgi:hypothetical protein
MSLISILLIVCGLITLLVFAYAVYLHKRLIHNEATSKDQLERLKREVLAVNSASMGVGQSLVQLEKKVRLFTEKHQQLEMQQLDYRPYTEATNLIEQGGKADMLIDRFGYSEAEANLLSLIQSVKHSNEQLSKINN